MRGFIVPDASLRTHPRSPLVVVGSPNGPLAVTDAAEGGLRWWDALTGEAAGDAVGGGRAAERVRPAHLDAFGYQSERGAARCPDVEALYREVAACPPDDDRLAELNRQFHFRIYQCARSPMLLLLLRLLWRSFPHGPHTESVRRHDALVRALKQRNEEQVAAIIRDHVLGSINYLPQR
jgi:hypothetical protein